MRKVLFIILLFVIACVSSAKADLTLTAGEGIDIVKSGVGGTVTVSGEDASDTNKGISSYDSTDFSVTSGVVSLGASPTATTFTGALSGNASTASALFANGANCTSGNYPLGVNASGAVEDCTALPSSMVYPGAGIPLSTGSAWGTSITDASTNWNTAYSDRLKWDGGSTGLTAATGRTSLEMGSIYPVNAGTLTNAKWCKYNSAGTAIACDVDPVVDTNTTYTAAANKGLLLSTTAFGLIETCSSGELLKWNGSAWACAADTTGASSGTPGGDSGELQFNDAGVLNGIDGSIYSGTVMSFTGNFGLGTVVPVSKLQVAGTVTATGFAGPLTGAVTGNASTATALAADPANCASSGLAGGVNASGVAEGCVTPNAGTNIANDLEEEVTEGSLADSTIVSADIKNATIVSADLSGTAGITAAQTALTGGVGVDFSTNDLVFDATEITGGTTWDDGGEATVTWTWNLSANDPALVFGPSRISTTSNLGIGSSEPQSKLTVDGGIYQSNANVYLANNSGNVGIGTSAPSQKFEVYGAGAYTGTGNSFFGGNVGIGSSAPARALDVTGALEVDTYIYFTTHYCYASGTAIVCAAR